ncbi:MAG: fimbrial major subunit CsuA/B family protein [Acidobacteria bacterium]|nr:fimbrial major subunit CsuA/B family protein [Acidobacteriota bacterium]
MRPPGLSTRARSVLIFAVCAAGAAHAQDAIVAEAKWPITASVTTPCTIDVGSLRFSRQFADQPGNADPQAEITVRCPARLPYLVALDSGLSAHKAGNRRAVANGPHTVLYELYQDSSRSRIWGDQNFAASYPIGTARAFVGTGVAASITIHARLYFTGAPAGTYHDVVTVTLQL